MATWCAQQNLFCFLQSAITRTITLIHTYAHTSQPALQMVVACLPAEYLNSMGLQQMCIKMWLRRCWPQNQDLNLNWSHSASTGSTGPESGTPSSQLPPTTTQRGLTSPINSTSIIACPHQPHPTTTQSGLTSPINSTSIIPCPPSTSPIDNPARPNLTHQLNLNHPMPPSTSPIDNLARPNITHHASCSVLSSNVLSTSKQHPYLANVPTKSC